MRSARRTAFAHSSSSGALLSGRAPLVGRPRFAKIVSLQPPFATQQSPGRSRSPMRSAAKDSTSKTFGLSKYSRFSGISEAFCTSPAQTWWLGSQGRGCARACFSASMSSAEELEPWRSNVLPGQRRSSRTSSGAPACGRGAGAGGAICGLASTMAACGTRLAQASSNSEGDSVAGLGTASSTVTQVLTDVCLAEEAGPQAGLPAELGLLQPAMPADCGLWRPSAARFSSRRAMAAAARFRRMAISSSVGGGGRQPCRGPCAPLTAAMRAEVSIFATLASSQSP
mmetsp:Transcript_3659/g.10580  ORF Transcript_3659/g.10580 Transcript_3659/m.10580 type:complete len:284 (-) Transcript_3659:132-983(-)